MKLRDKVAIITGSGRGIGKATSLMLSKEGANIVVVDINEENAVKVKNEIEKAGGKAISLNIDITSQIDIAIMIENTLRQFGKVDVLINNAGWDKVEPFIQNTEEVWNKIIDINFKGPIKCCKAVLPFMIENEYGKILNIASDSGKVGSTGEVVYSGTKGGIIAFSKALAREMARYKINVNCVCPGPTQTPLLEEVTTENPKIINALQKAIPMSRLGYPNDIASAVLFLVSDDAEYITGQALSVSGGLTMC